jgi:hypothetical protein
MHRTRRPATNIREALGDREEFLDIMSTIGLFEYDQGDP